MKSGEVVKKFGKSENGSVDFEVTGRAAMGKVILCVTFVVVLDKGCKKDNY